MAEFVANCPRCGTKAVTFDVRGDAYLRKEGLGEIERSLHEAQMRCRSCRNSSIAILKAALRDPSGQMCRDGAIIEFNGNVNGGFNLVRFISVVDQATVTPPDYLPEAVRKCFQEGAACLAIGAYNAAAAMFRLCLDLATKSLLPVADGATGGPNQNQRKKLFDRVDWLIATGRLPAGLGPLAFCVREDGNDGAHDGTLGKADAEDLVDFAISLLERAFTEPERLRLAEERRIQRRAT